MTEHNRFAVLAAPDVDMVGEDEMQGNGNPAGVVGAGGMGVRRVSLSSDSDVSGIEEADSQVGPQRSAASSAASSETDVEMDLEPSSWKLLHVRSRISPMSLTGHFFQKMDLAENVSTIGSSVSLVTPELVILAPTP